MQDSLENTFLTSIKENDIESLRRCLRIYATIDKIREVETLFKNQIVSPFLELTVSEVNLKSNPSGLQGMYQNIVEFIIQHCKYLNEATKGPSR